MWPLRTLRGHKVKHRTAVNKNRPHSWANLRFAGASRAAGGPCHALPRISASTIRIVRGRSPGGLEGPAKKRVFWSFRDVYCYLSQENRRFEAFFPVGDGPVLSCAEVLGHILAHPTRAAYEPAFHHPQIYWGPVWAEVQPCFGFFAIFGPLLYRGRKPN